ncbi:SMP-30/gluconolactonase/LRE family protein [Pleomorphovibrio marinus]|uniref:SMP-30/gluconolactonase/LRE family protein n=1 Tax=Pleomorphovibrio marinus TaxID=2164132 RepID=UPI000E0B4D22|nr:SMP-30/gluconolactonase/LRE family protein [Pleomorphovibrio marinus]
MNFNFKLVILLSSFFTLVSLILPSCESRADWKGENQALIQKHGLEERKLPGLPTSSIAPNLPAGKVKESNSIEKKEFYPGVLATIVWGNGVMRAEFDLESEASLPEEELPSDRFLFVLEGNIEHWIEGETVPMMSREREEPDGIHSATPRLDFVFQEKGTKSAVKAGTSGAKLMEVTSPIRLDYLQKLGGDGSQSEIEDIETFQSPTILPNRIYDLYDIQLTPLADGANSRLISGNNLLLSFISMDPNSSFPPHIHPEEQLLFVLRGTNEEVIMDNTHSMKPGDMVRIPGNMVHSAEIGEEGADVLDVFWPSRPDYLEKEKERMEAFHAIVPEDAKLELVIDGKKSTPELYFTEGPKWMNGKLYFSNMYFDQDFNGDPKKSSTVEMDPDGTYRNITEGKMQTNGLYPYRNGNLLVCDMMGHRVVEMTPKGQVVSVLAHEYNGKPIDGPNDIVTDAKGGFYFTDPQFTMEAEKYQPGRAVYYVSPDGEINRITEPNDFAMPNGIVLSPDGKTLFINNTYDNESWFPVQSEKDNYVWAYDVKEDGSISNEREFAKLFLTPEVLDRGGRSSSADGMAIDKNGNLYVATYYGVQIFDAKGEFVGMINLPSFPVSLCFGDEDMKTLYIVSYSKVFKIRTNQEGFVQYL